jgi:hypothetical protein
MAMLFFEFFNALLLCVSALYLRGIGVNKNIFLHKEIHSVTLARWRRGIVVIASVSRTN